MQRAGCSVLAVLHVASALELAIRAREWTAAHDDVQWLLKVITELAHESQSVHYADARSWTLVVLSLVQALMDDDVTARLTLTLLQRHLGQASPPNHSNLSSPTRPLTLPVPEHLAWLLDVDVMPSESALVRALDAVLTACGGASERALSIAWDELSSMLAPSALLDELCDALLEHCADAPL